MHHVFCNLFLLSSLGMSKEDAESQYVEVANRLIAAYGLE